ncbi:hypothetical protein J4U02_gp057 [Mycobacterium phage Aziz]|uniref:Uncharacterized protein n=2 Tax=Reyvirus TaxID=1623301 RepID=A0A1L6BYJ7_9CAUD|nr:hypothetical protein J4U02_gp057 [Mycobacterium phage Aziz]YP_010013965.1 hypothetical protein J4U04_gp059 [Mycobacterium phage MrMagoo]ARM70239.1 hypothetical protein SEA_GARDENSALSA_59 [Mycobacterium phage GardenSalsa]ASR75904.1 hypothetical protein SEA_GENEVAB15_57 [Mycobacterium phage GenevaB15]APQ42163.1 hypothetical protein PBI_MRMAGOO_59 [Mycobacterium phage MrMagoo]QNJ56717.1 hypothetical protein SEA_AZIZ_57 [Mycobacterium phage Aziz]
MTSSRAEFLADRNRMLELLWELDQELREWHSSGAWRFDDAQEAIVAHQKKMTERHVLHDQLLGMNCRPWHFDPKRDNCWLPRPQKAA